MKRFTFAMICQIVGTLLLACTPSWSTGAYGAAAPAGTIDVDSSKAANSYANFCRVTGTPEEIIFDFGVNSSPVGIPAKAIEIDHRVIMNFYTAKRLLTALQLTIQRHEETFGELELDVQKRVKR